MEVSVKSMAVERWGCFELSCKGPTGRNPFSDYSVEAVFTSKNETVRADGFYDGDGNYIVRFMPSFVGEYSYKVSNSYSEEVYEGAFIATEAGENNHGPVRVADTYHFAYEDGTPYYSIGTTCYVWELQSDELIEKTFESLSKASFNKIRFCIFPKHYDYNLHEPRSYPYEGGIEYGEDGEQKGYKWDYYRFNPEYFRHIEGCIIRLMEMGIEADLIVMHPYDRWGFSDMGRQADIHYWNYVVARFSAFRNVWWSLANEYDLMPQKSIADWERYARVLWEKDAYNHLRSIHNCMAFYDYSRPWITHCSIQRQDLHKSSELVNEWRQRFKKPVVLDEIAYEGNIQHGWGNISGEEMLRRFWEAACRGGYPGHGETYLNDEGVLWWSHGGELHGESWKRFGFLLDIMKETPGGAGLAPYELCGWDEVCAVPDKLVFSKVKNYYLYYYSFMRPSFRDFYFDDSSEFRVKVLDTWEMTAVDMGVFKGRFRIDLPGKQFMAVQIIKLD